MKVLSDLPPISKSLLCQIAFEGSVEKLELALEGFTDHHNNLIALDSNGRNTLHWASLSGNVNMLRFLVQKHKIPINCKDGLGWTPLMIAVSAGRHQAALFLIDSGASISQTNNNGQTALHFAVSKNRSELVNELLNNVDNQETVVNTSDVFGVSALHRAVSVASKEIVRRLVDAGASAEIKDTEGNTALHLAALEGKIEVIQLLIHNNSDLLRTRNKEGKLPFDLASNPDIRRQLIPPPSKEDTQD
ncbi:hypothetical protein GJ496_005742 [Pomphorhynchus laevis]|nr:hypothetical protein GJ496_005742 [Pomphorhynchus laevis]